MATNTTNYGFKKPDESDFYDVADQNKNWDLADEALKNLDTPTFEDYTGSTAVPSATDAIDQIKSKGKLGTLLSNIKAAFKGACLIGHIVNNCVTDNAGLPLSAAQGKVLKDLYTQLYSDSQYMAKADRSSDVIWFGDKSKNMFLQCRNYTNTKDMVATFSDGSTLEFPTKSDLSDLVIEKGFQKSVYIPAGNAYSSTECVIEYTVPSGYRALAIYKGLVTNSTCCVYNTYFTGGKARLVISNLNGSQKTVTAYIFILFIKS